MRLRIPMPKRLDVRLVLSVTILVILVNAVFAVISGRMQEKELLDQMIVGADQLSRSITSATWHAMLADKREAAYEVMDTIATKQGIDRIRIFNKEGKVMFSTNPDDVRMVNKRAEACAICHTPQEPPLLRVAMPGRSRTFRAADGRRQLGMITPIYNEPSCSAAACHAHPPSLAVLGVLELSLDLGPVDRTLGWIKIRALLLALAQIVVITLVIVLFTRRFVHKPIRRLILATKAVSAMQLDRPVVVSSSEEMAELARSFDEMRKRLRDSVRELNEFTQSLETRIQERTEQLRVAQQKLIQTDRLASLGQMAASVAHEVNNPIAGALNLTMLMKRILKADGIPPGRVEEFRGYLSEVIGETTRVGRIVSDLLAFSRRGKPHRGPADLNAVVTRTLSLLDHKLTLGNVRLELSLKEDLPEVPCDASQIQQVVINLVSNAAEAIQGEGVVTVRTGISEERDAAVLEVGDTGSGIAPEHLSKVFDPFFTTKEEGKGTGLGLAVSYGIVHAHGGDIEVSSRVGEGTTFRVTLPLVHVDHGQAAGLEPLATPGRGSWRF